jgi:hypothetical protein
LAILALFPTSHRPASSAQLSKIKGKKIDNSCGMAIAPRYDIPLQVQRGYDMQHISNLMSLFSEGGKPPSGLAQTPGDIGESLFRDFLHKSHRALENGRLDEDPCSDQLVTPSSPSTSSSRTEDALEYLERLLGEAGLPAHHMELPAAAVIRLARYLEKQGMNQEKIDQMIRMAEESDGPVRLDKLIGAIRSSATDQAKGEKSTISDTGEGLRLKENLFRAGLGAEEVKDISEKSSGEKGETVQDKLVNALEKHFQGLFSKEEIETWLSRFKVSPQPKAMEEGMFDPVLKGSFQRFAEAVNQDEQKSVKQEIAALMMEKGTPPEKVKSFLENLTVGGVKNLLDKKESGISHVRKEGSASQTPSWLDQVRMNARNEWSKEKGEEKVLNILEKDEPTLKKDSKGRWHSGEKGAAVASQKGTGLRQSVTGNQGLEEMAPPSKKDDVVGPPGEGKGKFDSFLKGSTHGAKGRAKKLSPLGEAGTAETAKSFSEIRSGLQPKETASLPQPLPRILHRMVVMARSGEQKGIVHISPPDLGRLDLEVIVNQGRLQAHMNAENLQAKEMIEAHLGQLRQQLTDQGFVVDLIQVKVGLDGRRFSDGSEPLLNGKRGRGSRHMGGDGVEGGGIPEIRPLEWRGLYEIDVHV